MPGKLKILISSSNYIQTLGQYGPVVEPTQVKFETALNIVNEGKHKVDVVGNGGVTTPLDLKTVKKMIRRGDSHVEDIWKKVKSKKKDNSTPPPKPKKNKDKKKDDKLKDTEESRTFVASKSGKKKKK